jgi:flagellar L-ring protein precursor FlgH
MIFILLACVATLSEIQPALPPVAPVDVPPPPPAIPGSLWSESDARALIGMDGNARRVGDLITVEIADNTTTSLDAGTKTDKTSNSRFGIGAVLGLETSILNNNADMGGKIELSGDSETGTDGTGSTTRTGTIAATLTCQVMEVMRNGNLRIRGTKQILVNREAQYLTLEGIVRPRDILVDNTIASDLIAEVRIEFTGQGVIADKQGTGWATRLGDAVWPF